MKGSYKKRLYTQVLSVSAAVLLAVLVQGNAAADTVSPAETPQETSKVSTVVEQPTPASSEKVVENATIPQTGSPEQTSKTEAAPEKADSTVPTLNEEIGRASCRERV